MKQRTIKKVVEGVGIGLHKGEPIKIRLEPLGGDEGIVFYRSDVGVSIKAKPENVVDTKMATVIGKDKFSISTIEHFLSAVYSYGIDNLRVVLDGAEVPVMDGSASVFCMLLDEAGIEEIEKSKQVMVVKKVIEVREGEKFVRISPSSNPTFRFVVNFDHVAIGRQEYSFPFSKKGFIDDISRARTFGFLRDVQYLRSKGLALGGSLDNAIVLDEKKILNPEGLRYEDEFVRHKILDALGDLSLLGMPVVGDYESYAGSHNLNHLLTKEILKSSTNYEIKHIESDYLKFYEKALA
ncbi:MAG: UDP-3-O-[3-hydroxymyristoyl] N-acetylglucosamine deacetylase [Proteobacteria bacterium]|nr:MAG: UDP-3-O-[3-hydroxymyristoyl] N-acetylglucosamine deacetylase [Pseudomonadota bacterium]